MADITIVATTIIRNARAPRIIAFTDANTGYCVYNDSAGDLQYVKTTDGGATWGSPVLIKTGTVQAHDIWFDKWTPGDTGTILHIFYLESGGDDALYRSLDTSTDTLGTERTIASPGVISSASSVFITGAKMRGGNLYCLFHIGGGTSGFHRSVDAGVNWTARTTPFESSGDWAMLYPGNEVDDEDAWLLYLDISANELTLKLHDDSVDSNSESAAIATVVENTTDGTGQFPWGASVRDSDGHLICAVWTELDSATGDLRVFDINGIGLITEKTALATDKDDSYYPSVYIDNSDMIYVAYVGKLDGTETLGTTASVYYAKSSDGAATWGTTDSLYSATGSDWRQTWMPLAGDRLIVAWRDLSSQDLLTNFDNSLDLSSESLSVGGSLTPSGALVINAGKAISGSLSPSGSFGSFSIADTYAGSLTPTSALTNLAVTLLSVGGGLTPTSTLTEDQTRALSLAGGLLPQGNLIATPGRNFGGSLTPTGVLRKSAGKVPSGELTPTGELTNFPFHNLSVSGSLTPTGTMTRVFSRTFSGAVGLAGSVTRSIGKLFAGVLSLIGVARAGVQEAPCGITRADLRARVYERLDDNATYYSQAEVNHALNVAHRVFCYITLAIERTTSIALTAGTAFYHPSDTVGDYLVPLRATISNVRIRPVTLNDLDMLDSSWRNTSGTPTKYAHLGFDLFAVYPQGNATLSLTYAASPLDMDTDDDEPEISAEHQPILVDFAIWWLRLKEGGQELANTVEGLNRFLDCAQKHAEFVRSRSGGQAYDVEPFDLRSFDRGRLKVVLKKLSQQGKS